MVRPSGWDVLGLDGDPTPGVVDSVEALAKEFGDFAHDVEAAYRNLNSFGGDTTALTWIGQTADAFKSNFGPLPGRLQKLYISYSEASDALSAYAPKLLAAQNKADAALRQAQDAHADLQRATTTANSAAADLKSAQQNQAAAPNPQAVTDAQTAHDTAQKNLDAAKGRLTALAAQAKQAYDDRIAAAKECAKALHHAQSDGIHNKHWWEHVGEVLSEWGGKIAEIANEIAPALDVLALATSWIPGVDVITAGLAEADNLVALAGTGMEIAGDSMQGHFGDALMGAGMLGATFLGGKAISKLGGKAFESLSSKFGKEAEERAEGAIGSEARSAEGVSNSYTGGDPVDLVSGEMVLTEFDVELPGVLPVVLRRTYASGYDTGHLFGPGWSSTLDQRLSINAAGIHYAGDDGQVLHYELPGAAEEVLPVRGARWPLVWDREVDEIRITDPWTGTTRHFAVTHYHDEFGQIRVLTSITDRNQNRIDVLRDEYGTPTGLVHPHYRLAFDAVVTVAGPRLTGIKLLDDSGSDSNDIAIKRYQYDDHGRLTGVTDSTGMPYTYEWDGSSRITAWIDRVGYRYAYEYGPDGRVTRGSGDGGYLSATFEYRDAEHATTLTNSLGHTTTYAYDDNGHVVSVTDPLGHVVHTEYDRYGRITSRTDQVGSRITIDRDDFGNPIRVTEADGAVTELTYDARNQLTQVRQANGSVVTQEYDEHGNLTAYSDEAGSVTRFEYAVNGALKRTIDPLGAVTELVSNTAGLPIAVVSPLGEQTSAERDPFGRIVRVTDPNGATARYGWSPEGQQLWRVTADGARTEFSYDAEGQLIRIVGSGGAETHFENGPFGAVTARVSSDGVRRTFSHDTELNLRAVADMAGNAWRYDYDAAGRLVRETDFIDRTLSYELDPAGRLAACTTALGDRIVIRRDAMGRITHRQTPEGTYTYDYDPLGQLIAAAGPESSLTCERDIAGRVIRETVNGRTTQYAYDLAGRRTRRSTPTGAMSQWDYDLAGRPLGFATGSAHMGFQFDGAGREAARSIGDNAWIRREHDLTGRLIAEELLTGTMPDRSLAVSSVTPAQPMLSRQWFWRQDGTPSEVRDTIRGVRRFTSDVRGRVTHVDASGWTESYAYDSFGNISASSIAKQTTSPAVVEPHTTDRTLTRAAGRTTYEHDAAGRLVRTIRRTLDGRRIVRRYSWDSEDRLVEVALSDGSTWKYRYDPLGRRISKTHLTAEDRSVEEIIFTWDGPRLAEQVSRSVGSATIALTWDYDPGSYTPAAQRRRTWTDGADQIAFDEAFYAIITDLVGTPSELVTTDGTIVWHPDASLWGRTISTATVPGLDCPLRFPGQYLDEETGLHYNLNRYYDPDTAAYITPDPLGLTPAPNDHTYVDNPLTWIDPLGLDPDPTPPNPGDIREASPFDLYRTEQLSGNPSTRKIKSLISSMQQNGWQGDPIEVRTIGNNTYVINGHHRVFAAKRAGINVQARELSLDEVKAYGYSGDEEVAMTSAGVPPDKIRYR